jgi:hypothetical protein
MNNDNDNVNPIEWALRVCESIAFSLHSIIGLTESCTGVMKHVTEGAMMPYNNIFFGVAGLILAVIAVLNFSNNGHVILGVQLYIVAFHAGAVFTHVRVGHDIAVALVPSVFIILAFTVIAIRTNIIVTVLGTAISIVVGILLGFVFVRPPKKEQPQSSPLLPAADDTR